MYNMANMQHTKKISQINYVEFAMTQKEKPSEIFKERLKAARDLRGLSQGELANLASLPPSSIAHFEIASRKPSFDTLHKIATALEVTTDYLLGRTDNPALAESGDPLYRDVGKLTTRDREIAKDFLKMLADRNRARSKGERGES